MNDDLNCGTQDMTAHVLITTHFFCPSVFIPGERVPATTGYESVWNPEPF